MSKLVPFLLAVLIPVAAVAAPAAPKAATAPKATAPALKGYRPCSLLTPTEAGKLLGAKPSEPKEADQGYKADGKSFDHDGVLSTCSWTTEGRSLTLAVSSDATTKEGKERGLRAKAEVEKQLKKKGFKVEKKAVGGAECTVLTPPKGVKAPYGTSCRGTKGNVVWYLSSSSKREAGPVTAGAVKALADTALGRLR